jgi:hypothetical protein
VNRRRTLALLGTTLGTGCLRLSGDGGSSPTRTTRRTTARTTSESGRLTPTPTETATRRQTASPTDSPTDTPTDSPTDSPTERETETEGTPPEPSYPLGLSEAGVRGFLMDVHQRELTRRGFRDDWVLVNTARSEIETRQTYRVADGVALGEWAYSEGGAVTIYHNNRGGFWREDLGSAFTYGEDRRAYSIDAVTFSRWIRPVLDQGSWSEPELIARQEPARWRVTVTGVDSSTTDIGYFRGQFSSLSGSAVVDEDGIIREIDATFTASPERGGTVRRRIRNTVGEIGTTSVQEPSWLSTAKKRRPTVSASFVDDRNYVRIEHRSGNPIEPDSDLTVFDENRRENTIAYEFREPVEAGETVFAYRDGPEKTDRIARGGRPENASPVPLDGSYSLWIDRGTREYFDVLELS